MKDAFLQIRIYTDTFVFSHVDESNQSRIRPDRAKRPRAGFTAYHEARPKAAAAAGRGGSRSAAGARARLVTAVIPRANMLLIVAAAAAPPPRRRLGRFDVRLVVLIRWMRRVLRTHTARGVDRVCQNIRSTALIYGHSGTRCSYRSAGAMRRVQPSNHSPWRSDK
ncbi:hypothetical protein EVAR_73592_1 [Eumeta japonica]|uniref:Uncharacterized protein n=1 Tax=Eumeta variegata TaxID=151549 RepID=A0A4C1SBE8_EUMVA|nr:hypothetical protein EVAR_73592_1 [Eumeta japonica]